MNEPNSIYVSARLSAATEAAQVGDVAKSTEDLDRLIRAVVPRINTLPSPHPTDNDNPLTEMGSPLYAAGTTTTRLGVRPGPIDENRSVELGDDYFTLWQSRGSASSVLATVRSRFGKHLECKLLRLEEHTDIVVLNDEGDAKITRNILAANIGEEAISCAIDKLSFEYPPNAFRVVAYDQNDASSLPLNFKTNTACIKKIEILFPRQVLPLETVAYAVEFSISGIFRFDTFWFKKVYPGVIRQSLSLKLPPGQNVRNCQTRQDFPDGSVMEGSPKLRIEVNDHSSNLHWEIKCPIPDSVIKTFWIT